MSSYQNGVSSVEKALIGSERFPESISSSGNSTVITPGDSSLKHLVLDEDTTISFSGFDNSQLSQISLILENGNTHSVTWPSGIFAGVPSISDDTPHLFEFAKPLDADWRGAAIEV